MSITIKIFKPVFISFLGTLLLFSTAATAQITLYTPYTKVTAPPGETLDYSIDIKNKGTETATADLYVTGLPSGWTYQLKKGKWNIKQLSILPGEKKSVSLKINIPYKVRKGTHRITVTGGDYKLPLYIVVSKQGNYETEFTCKQNNMQGHAKSNFTFSTELKNVTGERQRYALQARAPRGWEVRFKPNYKQATSVEIEPNQKVNMSIEIKPPYNVKAGTYKIPVAALNNNTSSELTLEVVVTGTYEMELTTPTGVLSNHITAGDEKKIKLVVRNTGSSRLENIKLSSSSPRNWEVTFDPKEIKNIEPGKSAEVTATVKAYEKAIAGDYVLKINASTPETNAKAAFRITVETSMLTGWLGLLVILLAIGIIYYLFRKYGRR
jgi:uncharacterized repeat protein (TIGR01451 family)